MKKTGIILTSLIALFSCTNNDKTTSNIQKDTTAAVIVNVVKKDARKMGPQKSAEQIKIEEALKNVQSSSDNKLLGSWVGVFGQTKINIFIANTTGKTISGHSVCAGNYREIKGELEDKGNGVYAAIMNEPGDNKYDGKFQFTIDQNKQTLEGNWTPFNAASTGAKTYTLAKKAFEYNPNVGKYPQGSTKRLTEGDVNNMSADDLKYMRNEIYARHGYSFQTKAIRSLFDKLDWYVPVCIDVRDQLTDDEVANIDLIFTYEKYYEESYDDYGR
jgi:hypothetical protein